mmetsp:Transcript_29240/g.46650  ORF Transcript_29240/g.46650 Transcript_29240/m.46650 type:complete len:524 (-) Transcript_29240:1639-3210(-)
MLLKELPKYSKRTDKMVFLLDEIHERNINTDVLIGILKCTLKLSKTTKLILMSATLNIKKYNEYFKDSTIINIPGRAYPVLIKWNRLEQPHFLNESLRILAKINHFSKEGDILIFCSGQEEIEIIILGIKYHIELKLHLNTMQLIPIFSKLSQKRINQSIKQRTSHRKCIVSTNIAETSITFSGLKYIIDNGYNKIKIFQPNLQNSTIIMCTISKSSAIQRSGRAGRTNPGICFRNYTRNFYIFNMLPDTIPAIFRVDLKAIILTLKGLKHLKINSFEFLDLPSLKNLQGSLYNLWLIGAIDQKCALTKEGYLLNKIPINTTISKLLINSLRFKCSYHIIIISSFILLPPDEVSVIYKSTKSKTSYLSISESSDFLKLLYCYLLWKKEKYKKKYIGKVSKNVLIMMKVRKIRFQIRLYLKENNFKLEPSFRSLTSINKTIASVYFNNLCEYKCKNIFKHLLTGILCYNNSFFFSNQKDSIIKFIIFTNIIVEKISLILNIHYIEIRFILLYGYKLFSINSKFN